MIVTILCNMRYFSQSYFNQFYTPPKLNNKHCSRGGWSPIPTLGESEVCMHAPPVLHRFPPAVQTGESGTLNRLKLMCPAMD